MPSGTLRAALGQSVSISADGNTVLAGAPSRVIKNDVTAGAGEVFTYASAQWTGPTEITLTPPNLHRNGGLGRSVALSSDGHAAFLSMSFGRARPLEGFRLLGNPLFVTVKAQGPYGMTPPISGILPKVKIVTYSIPAQRSHVTGTMTCETAAVETMGPGLDPDDIGTYPITHCAGFADQGFTIVLDPASRYKVVKAAARFTYTGPPSVQAGKKATLSFRMTFKLGGKPVIDEASRRSHQRSRLLLSHGLDRRHRIAELQAVALSQSSLPGHRFGIKRGSPE